MKSFKVLLVDESLSLREIIYDHFSDLDIRTTNDWNEVLSILNNSAHLPSLIICDVFSDLDKHIRYVQDLRSNEDWKNIPILVLTDECFIYKKVTAVNKGATDYLNKPFMKTELYALIAKLSGQNRKQNLSPLNQKQKFNNPDRPKYVLSKLDEDWLLKVEETYISHLSDKRLNVEFTANKLNLSTRQFHRKIKTYTGLTPNNFLRELRLQMARSSLIKKQYATIKEVSYSVGFNDVKYFSQLFQKRFGIKPSAFSEPLN